MASVMEIMDARTVISVPARKLGSCLVLALAVIFASGTPNSASAGEPAARYMQRVAKDLISAARAVSPGEFARAIRSHADYPTIGLYSLGAYRTGLPRSDRNQYFSGMINFIAP